MLAVLTFLLLDFYHYLSEIADRGSNSSTLICRTFILGKLTNYD